MSHPASNRFVLRGRQPLSELENDVAEVQDLENVRVLDRSARMLWVEGNEGALQSFVEKHPGWGLYPDVEYRIPERRPHPSH